MMDKIFDIADEAFNHRQSLDAKDWETRNWNNWTTLFVKDKQIAGTLAELLVAESKPAADDAEEEAVQASTEPSEAHCQLNETELEDYLKNRGEWPATLVSDNKLNLVEVLNPPAEPVAAGGKGAPKKAAPVAEVHFDESDLLLANEAENNFLLGDVIDQLIKLNFEERAKLQHPMTPNWLNLKMSMVGYPFSGTKSQAKLIKSRFNLDVFNMDELI
jgi:hypothetical protein